MESLPVIDISAWVSSDLENLSLSNLSIEQCHCCKRWNEELSKDGYAVLLNHGIEDEQFSVLNDQALDFFKRKESLRSSRTIHSLIIFDQSVH